MNTAKKLSGLALATAAAAMFIAAPMTASAAAHMGQVKCVGGNACKGKSECATAASGCKGSNSCKGKGWIHATKADCEKAGGKAEEMKK